MSIRGDEERAAAAPPLAEEDAKPTLRWTSIAAVLASIVITLGVVAFSDQIARFEELGYLGAFLIMLVGSATIILPAPAFVFVFALGGTLNPWLVGLMAGPGAAIGELTGYLAGYGGAAPMVESAIYKRFSAWMDRYGPLAIAVFAFVPNPLFDIAGLMAGASRMPVWQFLLAATVGKTARCILLALGGYYGLAWVRDVFTSMG